MRKLPIDLYLFALNCIDCFRKVVEEKEKRAKFYDLTLCISVYNIKISKLYQEGPPDAYSNRAELHPAAFVLRVQKYTFAGN